MSNNVLNIKDPIYYCIESTTINQFGKIDLETGMMNATLMEFGKISRNGFMYDKKSVEDGIKSDWIQERIRNNVWFGELEHPSAEEGVQRIVTLHKDNRSHLILDCSVNEEDVTGVVQFVRPKGDDVMDWIRKNSNIAFSLRGLTPTMVDKVDSSGRAYKLRTGKMIVVTFDCVDMPGLYNSRVVNPSKVAYDRRNLEDMKNWKLSISNESTPGPLPSHVFNIIPQKEEIDNVIRESDSARLIQDLYSIENFDSVKLIYGKENVTIKDDNGGSIIVPTNRYNLMKTLEAKSIYSEEELKKGSRLENINLPFNI